MPNYRLVRISKICRHAEWANEPPPAAREIVAASDAPFVIKIGDGVSPFAYLPAYGSGTGGVASGEDYELQFKYQGGFSADENLKWEANIKALLAPAFGNKVYDAGALISPWVPPLNQGASVIRGATTFDITIKVPIGVSVPIGYEFYWKLALFNSGTTVIRVNFDQTSGQYRALWKPPLPDILPGRTGEFWITTNDGGENWFVVGSSYQAYDIKFFVPGTPGAASVLWEEFVHSGLRLPLNLNDVGTTYCHNAPSAQTVFSIQRRLVGQSIYSDVGTLSFASGQTWSTWSFPGGAIDFEHGDRLRIIAPGELNGLSGLVWIMRCLI